ncbi:MAG: BrnA antitoxin family protein [Acidobacteria bacterium]|nr:BrnA antitoxin family protein [Acidobacteriota bacterium]
MRDHYDFSKGIRNPYAKRLKKQLTIRLDPDTIRYFQALAHELAIPYQTLMNMYLRDCAETGRRPRWVSSRGGRANSARQRATALGGRR